MATPAQPILVANVEYPETEDFVRQGVIHVATLEALLEGGPKA